MAVVAALVLLSVPCIAQPQQHFPTKPLRMIVGYTPGSEIDVIGRMVAHEMSEHWGQKVVVDNRPGAGSTVAAAIAAVASPDGYTLFFNSVSHAATPGLYSKLPFDTLRDFAGVSQVTSAPNVLVVAPAQGIKSLKELIAYVKQRPGQINYGSAGIGSGTHITGEMLILAEQFKVSHIPYKGVPEVLTDTMTGRVQYSFAPIGNTLAFVRDKRLLPLAVTTLARSPMLPDVPTVAEAAIAGLRMGPMVRALRAGQDAAPDRESVVAGSRANTRHAGDAGAAGGSRLGAEALHARRIRQICPRRGREDHARDQGRWRQN
jgi:tripartite-type tricarboxylate transporter receptor subunit TctC